MEKYGAFYKNVHYWLRKTYGNANHCEMCHTATTKKFSWALKKGYFQKMKLYYLLKYIK